MWTQLRSQASGNAVLTPIAITHNDTERTPERKAPMRRDRANRTIRMMSGGAAMPLTMAADRIEANEVECQPDDHREHDHAIEAARVAEALRSAVATVVIPLR